MNLIDSAVELSKRGFFVFPLVPNTKRPAIADFATQATRDLDKIGAWWGSNSNFNVGIYTGRFNGEGESLLGLDVDVKGAKNGNDTMLELELQGWEFPQTFSQSTPSGGRHLIYRTKEPVGQSASRIGDGLDVRGVGGYLVGAGSTLDGKRYMSFSFDVVPAPRKLIESCSKPRMKRELTINSGINETRAESRAMEYLGSLPPTPAGARNDAGFKVACVLKDLGVTETVCASLMTEHWVCDPMLEASEIKSIVENAYAYGKDAPGVAAPETQFEGVEIFETKGSPVMELNKEYAFITSGGSAHILWETKDSDNHFRLEHLSVQAFHQKLAPHTMSYSGKTTPVSQAWMRSKDRRSYDGLCFMPGKEVGSNFYNLWKGFTVKPSKAGSPKARKAFEAFLTHTKDNVCGGDEILTKWLIGYFAHLIQRPWEKPLVALVFRGGKGVGKNAFIERFGDLLGPHFALASDSRYLVGNFNSHLENCLLFALDEAFWSADKKAEGRLKDVITGKSHLIERKGYEPYSVKNCTRVVILGNESWLVPASHDERRFAVFDVGPGKKQDGKFFKEMREGLEDGGLSMLLDYLQNFDLADIDVNSAPMTEGLAEQKEESLDVFYQWWIECLRTGAITYSDFQSDWPTEISTDQFREAFKRYAKDRGVKGWTPNDVGLGRLLRSCVSGLVNAKKVVEGQRIRSYRIPALEDCRRSWDKFMGHANKWEPIETTD